MLVDLVDLVKEYRQSERQIDKYLEKMTFFDDKGEDDGREWKSKLREVRLANKPLQRKVKGITYTSTMHVTTSKDSKLLICLAKREPKIANMVGYNIKLTEKGVIQLARFF